MQIGLIGLQGSGKTKLFNTLAGIEENPEQPRRNEAQIEVVKVPDERLDKLTEMFNPKKKVNATIEVYDFPGLQTGDDGKVRITSQFLQNVRNNDALFHVVRQFDNPAVPHPLNRIDPLADIEFLETEFLLTDMEFLEKHKERLEKDIKKIKDDNLKREIPVIEKCAAHLEEEKPLRTLELSQDELKMLSGYQLLTLKPMAVAINFDESSIEKVDEIVNGVQTAVAERQIKVIPFFAEIEYEMSQLSEEDRAVFMDDYGIQESALSKILRTSYELLGLQSFFTVGEDECRAWTIKKNYTAQQAAGVIHTDFFNRFIRAEVVSYDDFVKYGSFASCKEAGVWRLEGKEYIVNDGDILNIRHN